MRSERSIDVLRASPARGIAAGIVGGAVMAMIAMAVSWARGSGVFAPLFAIAEPFVGRDALDAAAAAEGAFHWETGPAVVGAVVHFAVAAGFGFLFGLTVGVFRTARAGVLGWGLVYGVLVMAFMTFAVIPILDAPSMQDLLGWGTWLVMHLAFGATLGLWNYRREVAPVEQQQQPSQPWAA